MKKLLLFILMLLPMLASADAAPKQSLYGEWRLVGWNDGGIWFEVNTNYVSHRHLSIEIPEEGYVMAYSMVNEINVGLLTLNGNQITFGGEDRGLSTEVYCDIMENLFFEHHICDIQSYLLEGKLLKLYYTDNDYFVFTSDFNDNMAYRPLINDNKEWTMAYLSVIPQDFPGYQQSFSYEQIKLGSAIEVDGVTFRQLVRSQWNYGEDGPTNWKETDMYLGEAGGKVYLYDQWDNLNRLVQVMDFTLQEGDTFRQHLTNADHDDYADFVVVAVTDTVIATSVDKTPRKCLYIGRAGTSKIYDVWVEGIGSLVSGVYGTYSWFMNGSIPTLRSCQQDGQTLYEAYHPFLKQGKTWKYQEYYQNLWDDEQWTKDVSYVINGTTEIDGKTYYKMYRISEEGSKYSCALREEDRKVWMYTSDYGDQLLYDFGMPVGDSYMPSAEPYCYQLTDIKPMRFAFEQLLNVFYYDVQEIPTDPAIFVASAPIVEGVGCEKGWNIMKLYADQPTNGIIYGENFLSCYEDGKCIFTADDLYDVTIPKPDIDIAYRPFIEDGKVWKVGITYSGNPVQIVDHYYFEGDTIISGKTCKVMMCQRYVSPDYQHVELPSLSKVGAWYEENQKVYFYDEIKQSMTLKYDFSLAANDTLQVLYVDYIIGPKQTGGIEGFKGVYRDIMMCTDDGQNLHSTFWLEGVGGIDGLTVSAYNPTILEPAQFLMSCTVGDEVIYLNDEYEDGATPMDAEAKKHRFDFTHTVKNQPKAPIKRVKGDACISLSESEVARPKVKAPRRSRETLSLYGEYNERQLGINLDPLDDAYIVRITNESGKVVYEKAINASCIVALNIDISAFAKGRYTVIVENSNESFTGEFDMQTTGIKEVNSDISKAMQYYSIDGKRISTLQRGLNIVRTNDGKIKKVVVKK